MNEIISELEIYGIKHTGKKIKITAKIGKPYPEKSIGKGDNWACPVSLEPLYKRLPDIVGVESFQALWLASNLILRLLQTFLNKGGQLVDEDGSRFPMEAYTFKGIDKM